MATWNSRGLRGSTLEDLVNRTNEQYAQKKLALIQKIPTPITPVRMDKENRHITLAYFEQRSTVDYIGVVQGIPVCFDAKECCVDTFPLSNIHPHQVTFMEAFEQQGGIAFFLIFSAMRIVFIIFRFVIFEASGNVWKMADARAFEEKNSERNFICRSRAAFWCLIWKGFSRTSKCGIDNP